MKRLTILCALCVLGVVSARAAEKLNGLRLMADDLRNFGGAFTREVAKAPNLDRLAARSMRFEQAFAQYPVCNPSRTSLRLGLRCEQTGIVDGPEDEQPDARTAMSNLAFHRLGSARILGGVGKGLAEAMAEFSQFK